MELRERGKELLRRHGGALLGVCVLALLVHNIFGPHGFLAMRRTRVEIERVQKDIDRLNKENERLSQEVKDLKTDPHTIEKIAREDFGFVRQGEVVIKIPQEQPTEPKPAGKP
jgi:cell division protein FtsB